MLIEENKPKLGFGSWYYGTVTYNDKSIPSSQFSEFTKDICALRIQRLGLKKGDLIEVIKVGGEKPIKYKGTVVSVQRRALVIKQTKVERILDIWGIDDITVLEAAAK